MKQKLLLLMLFAMVICSMGVNAQTRKYVHKVATKTKNTNKTTPKNSREYKINDDGFEWYLVCKNGKYGAEDKNGNLLIPYEYTNIWYISIAANEKKYPAFLMAFMGDYVGAYLPNGKCIIPVSRKYTNIWPESSNEYGMYYTYNKKDGMYGFCDVNGKQLFEAPYNHLEPKYSEGKFFYKVSKKVNGVDKYGIIDGNGNVVIPLQRRNVYESLGDIYEITEDNKGVKIGNTKSINTTKHVLAANITNILSSSSNGSLNTNNSGSGTTTVVIEQHRDPVPVQEWVQCTACWGSTICPNCAGSGTTYVGSNLHRCSRCGGRKICTSCSGKGGRYITVYK